MKIVNGNLLDATEDVILHQCNCVTSYGKGLSKSMFDKFPYANTYHHDRKVGTIDVMKKEGNKTIINCYAQHAPGKPNGRETKEMRLKWFEQCLNEITTLKVGPIAVPFNIGCGLAGGEWKEYERLLEKSGLEVTLYKL